MRNLQKFSSAKIHTIQYTFWHFQLQLFATQIINVMSQYCVQAVCMKRFIWTNLLCLINTLHFFNFCSFSKHSVRIIHSCKQQQSYVLLYLATRLTTVSLDNNKNVMFTKEAYELHERKTRRQLFANQLDNTFRYEPFNLQLLSLVSKPLRMIDGQLYFLCSNFDLDTFIQIV